MRPVLILSLAMVTALVLFAMLYAQLPWWVDGSRLRRLADGQQAGILSNDRADLLKAIAGAGALVALAYTVRKHTLERSGQITDRYGKAIAQIGSDRLEERLGGIYALERIMIDSPRDQPTVVEVLAAFVREHAPRPHPHEPGANRSQLPNGLVSKVLQQVSRVRPRTNSLQLPFRRPAADVAAAMTVLARRPRRPEPFALDLRHTDLQGLELPERAHLAGANLWGADLSLTGLKDVDLTDADLSYTVLRGAFMVRVNLARATLASADLSSARLSDAVLRGAHLQGATFAGTLLDGADLTHALLDGGKDFYRKDLPDDPVAVMRAYWEPSAAQLASAYINEATQFDFGATFSPWLQARLADCAAFKGSYFAVPPTPDPASLAPAALSAANRDRKLRGIKRDVSKKE